MGINNKTIVFVGSGNMAQSIIAVMIKAAIVNPENIICNDIVQIKLDLLKEKYGVLVSSDKRESVSKADMIFLAVKPQNMPQLLEEVKPFIKLGALVISIAAGISTKYIEETLGGKVSVVRVMPNTPVLVGCGASALCGGKFACDENLKDVKDIFEGAGIARIMSEDKFDAITALSGSGPAYVFYLCELMREAGAKLGLDVEIAADFAVQTVFGAGQMLAQTSIDAADLRRNVTSPNGTTQAALEYFKSQNLSDIVFAAMQAAVRRSKEFGR
ncbi:MAG: pyrroline-5-carboxylate reductase [Endomicrobium sp.]|jgi:pyrroline-5-carboxylate reductase|nr:pyrroline-5-carboxylate reductase [Endomicrobium sp.]